MSKSPFSTLTLYILGLQSIGVIETDRPDDLITVSNEKS